MPPRLGRRRSILHTTYLCLQFDFQLNEAAYCSVAIASRANLSSFANTVTASKNTKPFIKTCKTSPWWLSWLYFDITAFTSD